MFSYAMFIEISLLPLCYDAFVNHTPAEKKIPPLSHRVS